MKTRNLIYIVLLPLLFTTCKPVVDDFTPSSGSADFTSFVAIGNSLTAGYAAGALYKSGQEVSFARIIAQQMAYAGGNGQFKIPLMPTEDGVGIAEVTETGMVLRTKLVLGYSKDCLGETSLGPVPANPDPDQQKLFTELTTSVAAQGPFNNVAVPGIKVTHLFAPGLGMMNPFYGRFATDPVNDRLIDEPAKVNPTFFSFWIGNNDVLDYAASGGLLPLTPVDGGIGTGFQASYEAALEIIMKVVSKGIVANIPDVTSIPFFTTVPYNAIVLTNQDDVDLLNQAYAPYNQLMEVNKLPYRINWELGPNPMVIWDKDMPLPQPFAQYKFRQAKEGELILLTVPQDSLKCARWGTAKPIPDVYSLTETEIGNIKTATDQFNAIIKENADANGLAFIDVNALLNKLKSQGIMQDGVFFTAAFVTGNFFSEDGIHMSPQGNAMVANFFIQAINTKYNANIPQVSVTDYSPLILP
ncbi:MAG: hypothetical protein GXO86_13160 [Chlorobi bacterium]|nr:hypothetical protein [Chlorobiota bacterium]